MSLLTNNQCGVYIMATPDQIEARRKYFELMVLYQQKSLLHCDDLVTRNIRVMTTAEVLAVAEELADIRRQIEELIPLMY